MDNLVKLTKILEENDLTDLIIISPENIEYFLGVETVADSLALLHISRDGYASIYVPVLEYYRFKDSLNSKKIKVYGVSRKLKPEDASIVSKSWKDIAKEIIDKGNRIGIDRSHSSPLSGILHGITSEKIVDVSNKINKYRMIKEDWEIEAIVHAIEITGKAIYDVVNNLSENTTETEVAGIFEYNVRKEGIRRYAFEPLILFKPGNSYPHNLPSNTRLGDKNLVLLDVGVKYRERCSDITRMVIWGSISEEEKKVIEIVNEAINRALETIQPGVKAGEVDKAARSYIEEKGYGNRFIHGLGHGIGVVVHEQPYIRKDNETILEPGMVFTVEPGIYIPGKYGVRIEEDVLVTKDGVKVLSSNIERVFT